jgi:hypothetical protein
MMRQKTEGIMGRYTTIVAGVTIVLAGAAAPVLATAAPPKLQMQTEVPVPVQRLLACRNLADPAARLACFDRETGSVATAITNRDLVAVDREKVRSTKRSLFGFAIPNLGVFGDDGNDQVNQIDGVLAGSGWNRDGGFTFRLTDGARWSQTDGKPIALEPRQGDKVVIKRGVLGSYTLSVAGQPGVKVQRLN